MSGVHDNVLIIANIYIRIKEDSVSFSLAICANIADKFSLFVCCLRLIKYRAARDWAGTARCNLSSCTQQRFAFLRVPPLGVLPTFARLYVSSADEMVCCGTNTILSVSLHVATRNCFSNDCYCFCINYFSWIYKYCLMPFCIVDDPLAESGRNVVPSICGRVSNIHRRQVVIVQ